MAVTRFRSLNYLVVVIVCVLLPLVITNDFQRHILIMFLISAMAALAIDLSAGHMGELFFGFCALWGTGAYTVAILTTKLGWSFWLACPLAGLVVSALTLLMAIPLTRITGHYFAFLTLGFALTMGLIVRNWTSLTGGVFGIMGLESPTLKLPLLSTIDFSSELAYSYLAMAGLLLTMFVYHRLTTSPFGRAVTAIRQNETLASSVGIHPLRYRLATLAVTGFFAGLAGALYVGYMRLAVPGAYDLWYSILPLVIMLVGGERHIGGALTGAFFLVYVPEYLRLAAEARMLIFGVLLILAILFMPEGIWPTLKMQFRRLTPSRRPPGKERETKTWKWPWASDEVKE